VSSTTAMLCRLVLKKCGKKVRPRKQECHRNWACTGGDHWSSAGILEEKEHWGGGKTSGSHRGVESKLPFHVPRPIDVEFVRNCRKTHYAVRRGGKKSPRISTNLTCDEQCERRSGNGEGQAAPGVVCGNRTVLEKGANERTKKSR